MQADLTLSIDLVKNGPQQTIRAQRKRTNACKNYSSSSYVHNMMIIDQSPYCGNNPYVSQLYL